MTIPVVETDRLRLRAWQESDFPAYCAYRTDAELQAFVGGAATAEQAWDDFCAMVGFWALRGYGIFAIERRSGRQAIGYTGLWFPPDIAEPELCWSLFHGQTGQGFATEAAAAARDWAYRTLNIPALMSFVRPDNTPSQAVAKRLGAELEGHTSLRGVPRLVFRHIDPSASQKTLNSSE